MAEDQQFIFKLLFLNEILIFKNKMKKHKTKERGVVSMYITTMIMIVSLGMILGLTVIFVGYLRIIRGMGNSVIAYYAANTGIERILFEDRICTEDCLGLISPSSFSETLTNGARFEATFSIRDNREHFESIGIFDRARRAIRVTR